MGLLPPLIQQILADTSKYNASMTEVQAKGDETAASSEASAEETGNAWSKAGLVVGAAVVAIGALAIDLAMKYQSATANLAANADISTAAATKIGNAFLGQAFDTTFSAQQTKSAVASIIALLKVKNGVSLARRCSGSISRFGSRPTHSNELFLSIAAFSLRKNSMSVQVYPSRSQLSKSTP